LKIVIYFVLHPLHAVYTSSTTTSCSQPKTLASAALLCPVLLMFLGLEIVAIESE